MALNTDTESYPTLDIESASDRRDYKDQHLCDSCWNSAHYHYARGASGKPTRKIVMDCLAGECECLCRALVAEMTAPKSKPSRRIGASTRSRKTVPDRDRASIQLDLFGPVRAQPVGVGVHGWQMAG